MPRNEVDVRIEQATLGDVTTIDDAEKVTVTPGRPNRDFGKVYTLTEWPALRIEKWAGKLLLALGRSGDILPEGAASQGLAGLAGIDPAKLIKGLQWDEAEPLLDEMLTGPPGMPIPIKVKVPNPNGDALTHNLMFDSDIEELSTLLRIRMEWLRLQTGFSIAAAS